MKLFFCLLGLLVLAGCGDERVVRQPTRRVVYPALNESPPPPPPPMPTPPHPPMPVSNASPVPAKPDEPHVTIAPEGWVQQHLQMEEQVRRLREYAAKADPDDPFALTEQEIEEFAKRGNPLME
jgi:hypothetical protein